MHKQVANPMINFNLMKTFISLYFHVDTNTQLNHFSYISKEAKFEVLQHHLCNYDNEPNGTICDLHRVLL
jgi:hypothetical protein